MGNNDKKELRRVPDQRPSSPFRAGLPRRAKAIIHDFVSTMNMLADQYKSSGPFTSYNGHSISGARTVVKDRKAEVLHRERKSYCAWA